MDQEYIDKTRLDEIRRLYDALSADGAFNIVKSKNQFAEMENDFRQMAESALAVYPHNPLIVADDVKAQYAYLRKLKFAFLQQKAKTKYTKAIISEKPTDVDDNRKLKRENELLKAQLKEHKDHLRATHDAIEERAASVAERYERVLVRAEQARQAAQDILDAQLELSRLRAAHPAPRLTIASATAFLDEQVDAMQELEDQRVDAQRRTAAAKEALAAAQHELERLRAARDDAVANAAELARQNGDARLGGLAESYATLLAQYRAMLGIDSLRIVSANEIHLNCSKGDGVGFVTLSLVFEPGQRRLAEARLLDSDLDIEDLATDSVRSNDVLGMVTGVRKRLFSQF